MIAGADPVPAAVEDFLAGEAGTELVGQVYGHVLGAVDLGKLLGIEEMLSALLPDAMGIDEAMEVSSAVIRRSLERVFQERWNGTDVPYGITEAEAFAVAFDADCPFCVAEKSARDHAAANPPDAHAHGDEPCPLCDDLAADWRRRHADVLRQHGLR